MYIDILPTRETVMRPLAFALILCAIAATPAAAQTREQTDQAARLLANPLVQEAAAAMVDQLAGTILDTHVGPLARYADPRDIRPTDTLRDVAHRRDPQFDAKLHAGTRHAVAATAGVAGDAIAMSAELQRTADRLRAAVATLAGALNSMGAAAPADDN